MAKKMTDQDRLLMDLEFEKSRLEREKSILVLNKSLFLYFTALFVAIIGFVNDFITRDLLNIIVVIGIIVLVIGFIPYLRSTVKEEKLLDSLIAKAKRGA